MKTPTESRLRSGIATYRIGLGEQEMYYHGFTADNGAANKYWTVYDDQLISLLFSKIITKTSTTDAKSDKLTDDIANNLFDLCFYINNDCPTC